MEDIAELEKQMNMIKIESEKPQPLVILYDNETLQHSSSKSHPENPQRLEKILENLKNKNLLDSSQVKVISNLKPIEKQIVLETHGQSYTEFVLGMWPEDEKRKQIYVSIDTYFNKHTTQCALLAAGGVIQAIDQVLENKHPSAFAIVRPPGHHAGLKSIPHGFCFLNNAGLGAKYALQKYKKQRVIILDWDAHHGEGTQNLFYQNKNVLYASLHRFDNGTFFPNLVQSGPSFIGKDQGEGYNINIGWNVCQEPWLSCGDNEYIYAFERLLLPVFRQFNPDLIIISCGFDSGCDDPIGGLEITSTGYSYMTQAMKQFHVPLVVVLEGGYNFQTLQWGSQQVVKNLLQTQNNQKLDRLKLQSFPNKVGMNAVDETLKHLQNHWKCLNQNSLVQFQNKRLKQLIDHIWESQEKQRRENKKLKQKKQQKKQQKEKKEVQTSKTIDTKSNQDNVSVITGASTGPMTRAKTKQIQKDQQI